jgi:hypothetical protein
MIGIIYPNLFKEMIKVDYFGYLNCVHCSWTEKYKVHFSHANGYSVNQLQWEKLYENNPEKIELHEYSGEQFGQLEPLNYMNYIELMNKSGFQPCHIGVGLWFPLFLLEENNKYLSFNIFSIIKPRTYPDRKSWSLNVQKYDDYCIVTPIHFRPTELIFSKEQHFIVSKI